MFGVNYRYEFNNEKGTIKLAPTKKFVVATILANVVPVVALLGVGAYLEKKDKRELTLVQDTPEEK